ncbi:MAG: glycosyltransferase family 39 protein [Chloroflexi bacterium]|nr:glycosyltransferase family 39 protein [Chloroflexota bacterium]
MAYPVAIARDRWPRPVAGRYLTWLPLLAVIVFCVAASTVWLWLNKSPTEFDQSMYYVRSLDFLSELRSGNISGALHDFELGMGPLAPVQPLRPVLVPFLTSMGYALLGPSREVAAGVIVAFSAILLVFCYLIAKNIAGWKAGFLASLVTLSLPLVSVLSRQYYFEVPLAALISIVVYLLLRPERLLSPFVAISLGLLVGLGMLIRENYPLFVGGPLVVAAGLFIHRERSSRKPVRKLPFLLGLGIAAALGFAVAAPFYLPKLALLTEFVGSAYSAPDWAQAHGIARASLWDRWAAFTYIFLLAGTTLPYLLLTLGAAAVMAFRRARGRRGTAGIAGAGAMWIVAGWLLLPYSVAWFSTAIDMRYVAPSLPAFAILLAVAVVKATEGRLQTPATAVVAIYAVIQFALVSFAPGGLRLDPFTTWDSVVASVNQAFSGRIRAQNYMAHITALASPRSEDWKVDEITSSLDELRAQKGLKSAKVFVVPYTTDVNTGIFVSTAAFRKLRLSFSGPGMATFDDALKSMRQSDFLLVKDANFGEGDIPKLMQSVSRLPFRPVGNPVDLPDGSHMTIYEKVGTG